jgi:predicted TIM-barrel fold metal-dependent hydrolase
MMAAGSMILGGVLERFPNLKVAFLEGNCSWLPWWLYRMDDQWNKFGGGDEVKLNELPSVYFQRQCFISIDADEAPAADMIHRLGDGNVVFSTDYPHPDSAFPHAVEEFLDLPGIGDRSKKKILWDNCARLYGLE